MTVFLWDHKLTYVSAPKVACTSLKHMFFEVENKRPFKAFTANGKTFYVHEFYKGHNFADLPHARIADHVRLTVVRDPVQRLLSSYSNRVVHHQELSQQKAGPALRKAGLLPDPDLGLFIEQLGAYCAAVTSIGHHTRSLVQILGRDPAYFDTVYPIERLDEFTTCVGQIIGRHLSLPHMQTGGPKISSDALTPAQIATVRRHYAEDYDIWGGYL